jgi:hypothetical protein
MAIAHLLLLSRIPADPANFLLPFVTILGAPPANLAPPLAAGDPKICSSATTPAPPLHILPEVAVFTGQ